MPHQNQLLSDEMKATADALRDIRRRLSAIVAEVGLPSFVAPADFDTVQVDGLDVAAALERMADVYRS
jgi:hypothetical protein